MNEESELLRFLILPYLLLKAGITYDLSSP